MPGDDLSPSDFLASLCLAPLLIGYMLFKVMLMSPPTPHLLMFGGFVVIFFFKLYKNPLVQKDLG